MFPKRYGSTAEKILFIVDPGQSFLSNLKHLLFEVFLKNLLISNGFLQTIHIHNNNIRRCRKPSSTTDGMFSNASNIRSRYDTYFLTVRLIIRFTSCGSSRLITFSPRTVVRCSKYSRAASVNLFNSHGELSE